MCVLAVSRSSHFQDVAIPGTDLDRDSEDFALVEASYTTVRLLQCIGKLEASSSERKEAQSWLAYSSHQGRQIKRTAEEPQKMTLVMARGDGCPVRVWRS